MTDILPTDSGTDKPVSPDFFHRFFVAYDAEVGHKTTKGYRCFSADKPTMNPHDIDDMCDQIAAALAKKYHIPVGAKNVALNNIVYLGYQDHETWTQNDYKKDADEDLA